MKRQENWQISELLVKKWTIKTGTSNQGKEAKWEKDWKLRVMGAEWELDRGGVVMMKEWTKMRWKQGGK